MVCPFCSSKKTKVTNSRPRQQRSEIWRRRECTACNRVFTTYEQPTLGHFTQVINPLDLMIASSRFRLASLVLASTKALRMTNYLEKQWRTGLRAQ